MLTQPERCRTLLTNFHDAERYRMTDQPHILSMFKQTGALLEGHFQLTSGLHSPQYFQCSKVLQHPQHLTMLAGIIGDAFRSRNIDTVISPALGGIVLGTEVGRLMGKRTIFAERKDGTMQVRRGFEIAKNERFLVVEDVVTTGGSVKEVMECVRAMGGIVDSVGFIVDRSNGKTTFGVDQFSVVALDVVTYPPEKCPLCAQGSKPVKPGSRGA